MRWSALSPRRRLLVLGVGALAVAVAVVVVVRIAQRPPQRAGLPDQQRPGPVLLVPGYGGSESALAALAQRLRSAGRTATVLALPGDGTGDLEAQAQALQAAVSQALSDGAPSVDVVGYSAGGVVARLWVSRNGGEHLARRVVTLGSPLHGAEIAAVGTALAPGACPVACQQLAPGSALVSELDAEALPAGLPWLSVWTADDQTVQPPDSARLAGAVNVELQQVCPDTRAQHAQLPTDPLVAGLVLRALGTTRLPEPGPGDCAGLRAAGGA